MRSARTARVGVDLVVDGAGDDAPRVTPALDLAVRADDGTFGRGEILGPLGQILDRDGAVIDRPVQPGDDGLLAPARDVAGVLGLGAAAGAVVAARVPERDGRRGRCRGCRARQDLLDGLVLAPLERAFVEGLGDEVPVVLALDVAGDALLVDLRVVLTSRPVRNSSPV